MRIRVTYIAGKGAMLPFHFTPERRGERTILSFVSLLLLFVFGYWKSHAGSVCWGVAVRLTCMLDRNVYREGRKRKVEGGKGE